MDDNTEFLTEGELPPEQKKRVAFAVGRFQPPTAGHYKVIDKLKEFTRKNAKLNLEASPVVVVIAGKETGKDLVRNPFPADDRIRYMQNSGRAAGVKFLVANNAFSAMAIIREAGFEPIAIAAGQERAEDYKLMLDKYFLDESGKEIKHVIVPGLERDNQAIDKKNKNANMDDVLKDMKSEGSVDDDTISGSLARRAAELGYFDEFVKIVGQEKNIPAAKQMYKKIRTGIEKTAKKEEE